MGRKAIHREVKDHPSPRLKGKVRLVRFVRGPQDLGWHVQFFERGVWEPRNPVALRTKDWDEACENARDKFTLRSAGQPVSVQRPKPENLFQTFAERAISNLRRQAEE